MRLAQLFSKKIVFALPVALLSLGLTLFQPLAVFADSTQQDHVWLDTLSSIQTSSSPNNQSFGSDRVLPCGDIAVWGDGLDAIGTLDIIGIPPTGSYDQAFLGTAGHPSNYPWFYDTVTGGPQIIAVVPAAILVNHAVRNGDTPSDNLGFHFRAQIFSQDLNKDFQDFWLKC